MTMYLSGARTPRLEDAVEGGLPVGVLVGPRHQSIRNFLNDPYPVWGGDNGVFSKEGFSPEKFDNMLHDERCLAAKRQCLFIVAPDVLHVVKFPTEVYGDARATLEQFPGWAREIRALGYPVALVAQDGLETMLHEVPWSQVDWLFIGGSTEWKEGPGAARCARYARHMGKRVHMGRVNSLRRMKIARRIGCDTADGTTLAYGPDANFPKLVSWVNAVTDRHHAGRLIAAAA